MSKKIPFDAEQTKAFKTNTCNIRYETFNDNIFIKTLTAITDTVEIPKSIDNKNVVGILSDAVSSRFLKKLIIPETVSFVARSAISMCDSLESVVINSKNLFIEPSAIILCPKLTNLFIHGNVSNLPSCLFNRCPNVTNIYLMGKIDSINNDAFVGVDKSANIYYRPLTVSPPKSLLHSYSCIPTYTSSLERFLHEDCIENEAETR